LATIVPEFQAHGDDVVSALIEEVLARSSDLAIVIGLFVLFAATGIAVSALSYRFVGRRLGVQYDELIDGVEKSVFAFIVFVLALTLADVRSNFAKAGDSVIQETFAVRQLAFDLELQPGVAARAERNALVSYLQAVVDDEWPGLGRSSPALSPLASQRLDELRKLIRADAAGSGRTPQIDRVWTAVGGLENSRQLRMQEATASAPPMFWGVMLLLMLVGMVMSGRERIDGTRALVLTGYFGALGLVVALILILDRPFRGETSVTSEPLQAVITQLRQ
jgi:hypothetical protein